MTLLELIGVLAILAILAAALVPVLIKSTDQIVANQETAMLQVFNNALLRSVQRNRYVPGLTGATNWAYTLATELGMNVSDIYTNARHQPRFFLIDPNLSINGTNATYLQNYGYLQDANGAPQPVSPRVIILSSLGRPFPASMVSGVPSVAADFSNLWNTADGQVPAATVSLLSGWNGAGSDLMIQRINLSPLFVQLTLNYYGSTSNAWFAIEPNATEISVVATNFSFYLIQSSILDLYTYNSNNLDSRQILNANANFVYYQNAWLSSLAAAAAGSGSYAGGTYPTNGLMGAFAAMANSFLAATNVSGAPAPATVLSNMTAYLNDYDAWAANGFPSNGATYTAATNAYTTMANALITVESSLGMSAGKSYLP